MKLKARPKNNDIQLTARISRYRQPTELEDMVKAVYLQNTDAPKKVKVCSYHLNWLKLARPYLKPIVAIKAPNSFHFFAQVPFTRACYEF